MRKFFPGYYRRTDEELTQLWSGGIFAFDANVLLNLYRYSEPTRETLFKILQKIEKRAWLTYQVGLEFHRNRLGVISQQIDCYADAASEIDKLIEKLKDTRSHPFISNKRMEAMDKELGKVKEELKSSQAKLSGFYKVDPILEKITKIFDGHVGAPSDGKQQKDREQTAKQRIDQKVPPGYRDAGKDGNGPLGDAIFWLELVEYATSVKKPVILITDDTKDDWWTEIKGQTIGPRPELVWEFRCQTNQLFHAYQPVRFIELAKEHLGIDARPDVIDEVRDVTRHRAQYTRRRLVDESIRDKLRHLPLSQQRSEEFREFVGIGKHIGRHIDDIQRFINLVAQLSDEEWLLVEHPLDLDAGILNRVEDCIRRCPCVAHIASEVSAIPAPTYHLVADDIEKVLPEECIDAITRIRRMPQQAVEIARMCLQRSRQGKDSEENGSGT